MINHIQIRNFAIVDQLELLLSSGMTVLTGETGAGKSILFDALNLALGGRAESGIIRHGTNRAEITVNFDLSRSPSVKQWMIDNALDDNNDCLIRRIATTDGRSKGFINGQAVPMQSLRELGEQLVDIQGQHAHQSLLKQDMQRQALDDFAGHQRLHLETKQHYQRLKILREQQTLLKQSKNERASRIELLSYQTQELEDLCLKENEFAALEEEHSRLAHLTQIEEGCKHALFTLTDAEEQSVTQQLNSVMQQLDVLQQFDINLQAISQMLNESLIQTQEASNELRHYLGDLDMNPKRMNEVDERLGLIHDLSRKHRINPKELTTLYNELTKELASLLQANDQSDSLDAKITEAEKNYFACAKKLSISRQSAAKRLQQKVTANLQQLGMKTGQFNVTLHLQEDISINGLERVEFLVTMNPGQPLKPLNKVASGGELSRISLAIQVIIAATGRIPTLLFDEVDVGIGGGTAEIVGRMLRDLSRERQVICVTHQPQVAALGHQHLQVNKLASKNTTKAHVNILNESQRADEIARMLGGIEITEQTLSHAKEMINRSQSEPV
ncbi:MAG: DNA repair protein RecN [Gammaproteobacteria bacterium]|nr:DNA repair protein RecN [Gammaproteobacteria bacterium]